MYAWIRSQFGRPRGVFGALVGWVMAIENRDRVRWGVEQLGVGAADRVLEVGFGPGVSIEELSRRAADGYVAGVDHSAVMVRQARRRNAAAIRRGQVDLHHASVAALPFADDTFDRALAVNSLHHWPDPLAGLRELRRVLKPGGRLVIVVEPRHAAPGRSPESAGEEIRALLAAAGFGTAAVTIARARPADTVAVSGVKPAVASAQAPPESRPCAGRGPAAE